MTFDSLLCHTCTTKRFTEGDADDYGNPVKTWNSYLIDEPCRLASSSGREVKVGAEVVIADYKLFIDDLDITEQDRVIVNDVTYEVLLVEDYNDYDSSHHKQCWMRTVR